jgi:glutamate dehydrogenase (NADP+)
MVKARGDSMVDKTVVISGSGNVAIYAAEKAYALGAKPVTLSDSNGYIYDPAGINLSVAKDIKEVRRARISEYLKEVPGAEYFEGRGVWSVPCDIALPCATQNELNEDDAKTLIANGCKYVGEGANMPSTPEAVVLFKQNHVYFAPGKAANAGGVATSALEMSQNSMRLAWTFEEVDEKLHEIMKDIFKNATEAATEYGDPENLMLGANVAGMLKVADAMTAQGIAY